MMMNSPAICFLIWPWQIRHQIHWIPSIPSNYPCPLEKSCLMSIHVKKQAGTVNVTLWLCQNSYWTCTIEIVDLPIKNGDVPSFFVGLPGRVCHVPHPVTSPQKMPYPYPESWMLIHPTLSMLLIQLCFDMITVLSPMLYPYPTLHPTISTIWYPDIWW